MSRRVAWLTLPVLMLAMAACASDNTMTTTTREGATLRLVPSRERILAGESITIQTQTRDVPGKQAHLEWATTGGALTTQDEGRIARIAFHNPGTYAVTARLIVDDRVVSSDTVQVRVRPLR